MPNKEAMVDRGNNSTLIGRRIESLNIPRNAHSATASTQCHRIRAPAGSIKPVKKFEPTIKQYQYYEVFSGLLEDTLIVSELRRGARRTSVRIKMSGHGGQGELKKLTIHNLQKLNEQISQLLRDYRQNY